jgi:hypothetical protein
MTPPLAGRWGGHPRGLKTESPPVATVGTGEWQCRFKVTALMSEMVESDIVFGTLMAREATAPLNIPLC